MSKAVLISIHPEWCNLIADGKKTVEIRKTVPREFFREYFKESNGKCGDYFEPFKVYIYCTKADSYFDASHRFWLYSPPHDTPIQGNGKIIGEFVCDKITELAPINKADDSLEEKACLSREEIVRYLKGKGYAWHISDLVVYDKPKGLGKFTRLRATKFGYEPVAIKRPPQSWCYVEERRQ